MRRPASTWQVPVGEASTTAAWDPPPENDPGVVFVCAHGAGGQMNDRSIPAGTRSLRAPGIGPVRFNFLCRERGSGRPDPMPKLLECWESIVSRVRTELEPTVLVLGGRSMGGRGASMLVAAGGTCDGLLLLAYPLDPPGQPGRLRVEHLPRIR